MEIDGVRVLAPEYIIPFKAKAWLDLCDKRDSGYPVDEKDIKKHKNDVARLTTILSEANVIQLPKEVILDMQEFIREFEQVPVDIRALKIKGITSQQIVNRLKKIYLRS